MAWAAPVDGIRTRACLEMPPDYGVGPQNDLSCLVRDRGVACVWGPANGPRFQQAFRASSHLCDVGVIGNGRGWVRTPQRLIGPRKMTP
eukprot:1817541-Prymnesium_polylepis.1